MEPVQPVEECIIVTVEDQSKLALVMELLSHFDLVRARREKLPLTLTRSTEQPLAADAGYTAGTDADFWALAGIWENRQIDADQLRQQAWKRANGNQL